MDPQEPTSRNNQFFNSKDYKIIPDNTDQTHTSSTTTDDPTHVSRHHVEVHPGATDIANSHQAVLSDTDKPLPGNPDSIQNSSTGEGFQHGKDTTSAAYNPQLRDHSTNTPSNTPQNKSGLVDDSNTDPLSSTSERNLSSTATHGSVDTTDSSTRLPLPTDTDPNTTNPNANSTSITDPTYTGGNIGGHNTDPTMTTTTTTTTTTNNTNTGRPSAAKGLKDTVAGTVQKLAGAISGNPERRAAGENRVRDGKEQLAAANEHKKGTFKSTEGHGRGDLEGTHVNDQYDEFGTNTNTIGGDYDAGISDAGVGTERHGYGRGDLGGAEVGTEPAFATANTKPANATTGNITGSKGHGRGDLEGIDAKEL